MLLLHFCDNVTEELRRGIAEIAPLLEIKESTEGLPVSAQPAQSLSLSVTADGCTIDYSTKAEFFRALGLLARYDAKPTELKEKSIFNKCGVMFDCSRNAVLTLGAVKNFLRRMALMGLDLAMMYTEDTYTVEQRPYFGYLRGRYSCEEMKEMDDYADIFGIEMIPCIQTLAHLERALQFPCMESYRDTDEILMVGEDETYDFLREIIAAATAPLRSNRIHIGMDEASWVGRGKHLNKYGYMDTTSLMKVHLERVHAILREQNLSAMMWSDMHFTAAHPGLGLYHPDTELPSNILLEAPYDIDLVFWDYYHEDEKQYANMFQKHAKFSAKTIFAGGIWTWLGPAVDYRKTKAAMWPALEQCKKNKIGEVFATAWQDDGAECNLLSLLYGLQLFAEYRYTTQWNEEELAARFIASCGADAGAFLAMSKFNELPGLRIKEQSTANPGKMLLYEDPLMPLFEIDLSGKYVGYYTDLEKEFSNYRDKSAEYALLFDAHACLATVLKLKCEWREQAAAIVRAGDRAAALALCPLAKKCADSILLLQNAWRALWMSTNKPFGFEVLDTRLGGIMARFGTAAMRMEAFAKGELEDIPELSTEKLALLLDDDGCINCHNSWASYISTSRVSC